MLSDDKIFDVIICGAGLALTATQAGEKTDKKEVTLKGTITCAKCDLGVETNCMTVIVYKKGGLEVERRLFQYHSSCGTRPLALYSVEALLRGMVETNYAPKMIVVGLPNHGLLAASPLPLEAMTELFNPERPTLEFGDIPML